MFSNLQKYFSLPFWIIVRFQSWMERSHSTDSSPTSEKVQSPSSKSRPLPKKQGELYKRGTRWQTWNKRWFVLDAESLSYYQSQSSYKSGAAPLGTFCLADLTYQFVEGNDRKVDLICKRKSIHLKSDSKELLAKWIEIIQCLRAKKDVETIISESERLSPVPETFFAPMNHTESVDSAVNSVGTGTIFSSVASSADPWANSMWNETQDNIEEKTVEWDYTVEEETIQSGNASENEAKLDSLTPDELFEALIRVDDRLEGDEDFQNATLLYHKCFLDSSEDLLNKLLELFFNVINLPSLLGSGNASPAATQSQDSTRKLIAIKMNIVRLLQTWMKKYNYDFNNKMMKEKCREFITRAESSVKGVVVLENAVKDMRIEYEKMVKTHIQRIPPNFPWKNLLRKFADTRNIVQLDAKDIAAQLTKYEWELFRQVQPREFVNGSWIKKNAELTTPVLYEMTRSFDKMTMWVGSEILQRKDDAERRKCIAMMVNVGAECLELGNYWGAFEIASGLWIAPVYRLKADWSTMDRKVKQKYSQLIAATGVDGDFGAYRKMMLGGIGRPQIPQIPLHLRDLISLDSLESKDEKGNICFGKYLKQWRLLSLILQNQESEYTISDDAEVLVAILKGAEVALTREEMFKLSYEIAPKKIDGGSSRKPTANSITSATSPIAAGSSTYPA